MGNVYIGDSSSKARELKNAYIGVSGVARKIKAIYVGVNGVAKLVWEAIKKYFSKYTNITMSPSIPFYNYAYSDSTTQTRSASITSYKKSEKLPYGIICDTHTSRDDGTGTTYYIKSIQKFSIDNNSNMTNVGRITYNYSWGGTRYDGSWYNSLGTNCVFYTELGNYLFMCLQSTDDGDVTNNYYAIRDWSNNTICSADFYAPGVWYPDEELPRSGAAFSDTTMIVGVASSSKVRIGIVNFNGSSLTQTYYYPNFIDSKGTVYNLRTLYRHPVNVTRLEGNVGIITFQGATYNYCEEATGGTFIIAFRLNNDGSLTFGKTMYVKEGYSGNENTSNGILLATDKNHAVMYENYYSSGSSSTYYSKKWFALYIDDNLNISITDRYNVYDRSGFYSSENFGINRIGSSNTFAIADSKSYTDSSKNFGLYLYKLDTTTNKIVSLGEKMLPATSNVPYGHSRGLYNFAPLGDDKIISPYAAAAVVNATTTDLYAYVGSFE